MGDDDARKRILARRAQFVAAAVVGLVACEPGPEAQPPQVCLSIALPPPDAGEPPLIVDAGASADPDAALANADASEPPMPCLSPPQPCLSVALPDDASAPPRPCLKPVPPPRPPPTTSSSAKPPPPRVCLSFDGP